MVLVRHSKVFAEGWWHPYAPKRVQLLYSLSKSFTSTALGLLVDDGLVRLDDTVLSYFPELVSEVVDERTRRTRLRHLAAMSSGHLDDTWHLGPADDPVSPVRAFLRIPPEQEPGSVFAYNQSATYTIATIVQRVAGCTMSELLARRVFGAIGADAMSWLQHPDGQDIGFSGLHATTETIACLGELYLRHGAWRGMQILSKQWVDAASSRQVATAPGLVERPPDWQEGYGYQFWRSRHGYRGDGAFGQFCLVLPEHDAVVALTGQSPDMQAVLDAVWRNVLPALQGSGEVSAAADAALAKRLDTLELARASLNQQPAGNPELWRNVTFDHVGFEGVVDPPGRDAIAPAPLGVRVVEDEQNWRLVVAQGQDRLHVPLLDAWSAATWEQGGAPVFARGGWTSALELVVELVFVETPHRLVLSLDAASAEGSARWIAAPLHGSALRQMGAPATLAPSQHVAQRTPSSPGA